MAAAGSTASDGEAATEGKYAAGRRKSTTTRSPSARMPTPSGPLRPARRSLAPTTSERSEASGEGRAGSIRRSQLATTSALVSGPVDIGGQLVHPGQ